MNAARFFTIIAFLAISISLLDNEAPKGSAALAAGPPVHRIVGSGFVDLNDDLGIDVSFTTTVAAFQNQDGSFRGTVVSHANLAEFGLGTLKTTSAVVCIVVDDGYKAWIESVVTHTNNPDLAPVGTHFITMVFDLGREGEDIMHTEAVPDGVHCEDRPELFPSIVDSGNFSVR